MKNKLRTLWGEGATGINAWLGIPSTVTAEIVSRQGFDAVTVDLQHGINDYSTAVPMLQAMAGSDATLWRTILEQNRDEVLRALRAFEDELHRFQIALSNRDYVEVVARMERGKAYRDQFRPLP